MFAETAVEAQALCGFSPLKGTKAFRHEEGEVAVRDAGENVRST